MQKTKDLTDKSNEAIKNFLLIAYLLITLCLLLFGLHQERKELYQERTVSTKQTQMQYKAFPLKQKCKLFLFAVARG